MIVIVDYGMGNLRSVAKALEHLGASVRVSEDPAVVLSADKLILPGVGAFGDACRELKHRRLFDAIVQFARLERPFLGICLGLQLLFAASEESPEESGLNLFNGTVQRFHGPGIKIPHMGWNTVELQCGHPLLNGLAGEPYFYFVHSYYAVSQDEKLSLGRCRYGNESFPAILGKDHIAATQFHPEKSQAAGLKILENFIRW